VAAAIIAMPSMWAWSAAPGRPGPLEYGEGSVAHAGQLIARGADPYAPEAPGRFVAAIYPPISYAVAAAGERFGPFVALRLAALAATIAVAVLVAVMTRRRGLAAIALGVAYLATYSVRAWAGAHRPDDLAVLFTAGAVVAAGSSWRRAAAAGVLGALAIFTKQTAVVPLGFVLLYLLARDRVAGRRLAVTLGTSVVALGAASALFFGPSGLVDHLIGRNATEYAIDDAAAFGVLAILTIGAFVLVALRIGTGRMRAYLFGAFAVVLLAGREGASVNFQLDLGAAAVLGIATAPLLRGRGVPLLLAAQLVAVWAVAALASLPGAATTVVPAAAPPAAIAWSGTHHLVEDSGLLVAAGIEPEVDELFVWSHLVALGRLPDEVTPRVRSADFASIVSSVPLDQLDSWPVQRQRWLPALAEAVLERYRLESSGPGFYRYVPR